MYSWSFFFLSEGLSTPILSGANTATPSFVAGEEGSYVLQLIVTDEHAVASLPDYVTVSSDNQAPTAAAGDDQLVITGTVVVLDGTGSIDPETDPLSFDWVITNTPSFSTATLTGATTAAPTFIPDLDGVYEITLTVSDFIGPGTPDSVEVTSTTAEGFAEIQIVSANDIIKALSNQQVTTKGNQNALQNFLRQAIAALQEGDLARAIDKLEKAIARTDGCALRGAPDGNGGGRDWITECASQADVYTMLNDALDALLAL